KHNINIWFNTIHRPVEWSIWALPHSKLQEIYSQLEQTVFTKEDRAAPLAAYNIGIYNNLVKVQIKNWVKEAEERELLERTKTAIEIEEDAKDYFEKKLKEYIYQNFNEGEEQKKYRLKNALDKTEALVAQIKVNFGDIEFYKLVREVPPDVFYKQLESRSITSMLEEFAERFKESTPVR
ncbi:MAG TPA: hypothetical protein VK174_11360, partial [Chitinophagales bacterium]|nr:hypothetical protein [Chitinophagales bacterium]